MPVLLAIAIATGAAGARERPPLPMPEPATPSTEMLEWARRHVPAGGVEERLEGLLEALVRDRDLALAYDADFTATAVEVFADGRFNCLSFAHLYLGLARSLGLEVDYVQVPPRRFVREDDLVLAAGHVTVGYGRGLRRRVLEIGSLPGVDLARAERISDERAHALHWVNLGARSLLDQDLEEAERRFRRALELEPGLGSAWTNLGVVRRRRGFPGEAEALYRRAIEVEGGHVVAYENLFALLAAQGRDQAAQEIERLIVRRDARNPFAWLALGDFNLQAGRVQEASRFLKRAYRLAPRDAEVLAARGEAALAEGRHERARRWWDRAQRLDPDLERVVRLGRALGLEPGSVVASSSRQRPS